MDSDGNVLADGQYAISVQANSGGSESVTITALVQSEVIGVESDTYTGSVNLITLAGTVALSSILAAYDTEAVSASTAESTEDTDASSEESSETESETAVDASYDSAKSILTIEEQIVQDSLQYYLTT
ncbi:MAG: hypothetical protein KKD01_09700 [Proteobacteria bacterium]|nr:hypothetical protein [Pseudomonadota bacterium]MBU1233581.1 hypothetical protein [Pseudomonadota bacterium]MBU1420582.1 hypothetical protein [Pseudomonadota bacterium]MBU1454985.1 hypothetical protein [Pseudomonadota bacterium]